MIHHINIMLISNKIIDKCLKLTFGWDWFNKTYAKLIRIFYIPIFSCITKQLTTLKVIPRHSINTNNFKAFGSDIDITLVGNLEYIQKWRNLYHLLKKYNRRLGEWEFYTFYEFQILESLKLHKFNKFWEYLCLLRKLSWIESGFKPNQEFKKQQAIERILKETGNLKEEYTRHLLRELTDYNGQVTPHTDAFKTHDSYLNLTIGNTDDSILKIQDLNLYNRFISLLPSNIKNNPLKNGKLLELKYYIVLREVFLTLAGARYVDESHQDSTKAKTWLKDLKLFLLENSSANIFNIDLTTFIEKILDEN